MSSEEEGATYVCQGNEALDSCPYECEGLANCEACDCAVQDTGGGPWGQAMDVILCLLPIIFLLVATLPPGSLKPLPTTKSLPISAFLMFLVRLMYLGSDPLLVCASVVKGVHEAVTPLSIMAGAIMLFETMEVTRCMPYMMREMKALTGGHTVAELLIVFCFAYMVEGASGFGTPAALGAPMLISLGHPKLECVVILLLMNTFATVWGAAGTPIWYGFGSLGLSEDEFVDISFQAGVALVVAAYVLVPFVFTILVPMQIIKANSIFFLLALSGCILPALGLSYVSYEFPALLGGMIGMGITGLLIHFKVGLKPIELKACESTGRHPLDIGTVSENSVVAKSSLYISQSKLQPDGVVDMENGTCHTTNATSNASVATGIFSDRNGVNFEEAPPDEVLDSSKAIESIAQGESTPTDDKWKDEDGGGEDDDQDKSAKETAPEVETEGVDDIEDTTDSLRAVNEALGPRKKLGEGYLKELTLRTLPITLTVLLLIVTRIPQIGLKDLLTRTDPYFEIYLQTYGTFRLSASLVFQLDNILTYPNLNWKYELLYTPFLIPFVLVSLITLAIFRKESSGGIRDISGTVFGRIKKPAVALAGALCLVQLLITGEDASPANIIGITLSDALKGGWIVFAAATGALGSFFSGSTTVSNLTFGGIQQIAAESIGTSETAMLALQAAGASAGNGICLNNIISVCTVVGLDIGEGKVIGKTWIRVASFLVIATLIMLAFLF